jgi:hypothetical protein
MGYQSNVVLLQLMKMSSPCCVINFTIEICFKTNTLERRLSLRSPLPCERRRIPRLAAGHSAAFITRLII